MSRYNNKYTIQLKCKKRRNGERVEKEEKSSGNDRMCGSRGSFAMVTGECNCPMSTSGARRLFRAAAWGLREGGWMGLQVRVPTRRAFVGG